MKSFLFTTFCLISSFLNAENDFPFGLYFNDQTLRIDYFHTGDAKSEEITLDKIYVEGIWAGNPDNCLRAPELGMYKVKVEDVATGKLLFMKGFNSIFAEYKTIDTALKGIRKTFHESVLIPFPKRAFRLIIEKRERTQKLSTLFTKEIDPSDYHIIKQKTGCLSDAVFPIIKNGKPHEKVDIAILAEGYQRNEIDQFKIDLENYTRLFFSVEPYKSRSRDFNVYGVFSASEESGTDEPRQMIYKNTRFGSSFNYFDLDRYCLADENKSIRDVASNVPYDAIIIMVNRERYGGGGIYNWQTVFTARSERSDYVFLHEFGHGF
ncbi:MAG TPA: M64 family metallopeptidase, partial [Bacteroidales bacterium]|nr:M64 family metallopeptidase [Bacteroidales bacterium]